MKITTYGELMMRLDSVNNNKIVSNSAFISRFAGSEANVAVALSYWGLKVQYLTALPDNDLGLAALLDLNRYRVDSSLVHMKKKSRLGLFFVEHGSNQRSSKVLYDREGSAFCSNEFSKEYFRDAMLDSSWFHWSGITPGTSSVGLENIGRALEVAQDLEISISCDLNYRNNLWKFGQNPKDIMPSLVHSASVIMGNEEDVALMLGLGSNKENIRRNVIKVSEYKDVCNDIFEKYTNCKIIALTLRDSIDANRNNWSAILATRDVFLHSDEYQINNIVDRIGSGDAFSAGIIYGLNSFNGDLDKVIKFATSASCLKHSIPGDYCLFSTKEIDEISNGNTLGRIER